MNETKHGKSKITKIGWWIAGLVVATLTIAILFLDVETYLRRNVEASRITDKGIAVKGEQSRVEAIKEVIGANSLVEPISTVSIASRVGSSVEEVKVDIGEVVREGDVMARLDRQLLLSALRTAQDNLVKARTELENSRNMLERVASLYEKELVPRTEVENSQLQVDSARAGYSAVSASLEKAQLDLEKGAVVKSPITGIVQQRSIDPGETVKEGDALFVIGRLDKVMVAALVAEEKIASIHIGQKAEVVFDAFRNEIVQGEIVKIDPSTDPETRTFKAFVMVENPDLKLKPGLSAYTRILSEKFALTIPKLAVITKAGQSSVFVVEDSRARIRPVKIEPGTFGRIVVVEGLSEGEVVIYYGLLKLKDNDPVDLEMVPSS